MSSSDRLLEPDPLDLRVCVMVPRMFLFKVGKESGECGCLSLCRIVSSMDRRHLVGEHTSTCREERGMAVLLGQFVE